MIRRLFGRAMAVALSAALCSCVWPALGQEPGFKRRKVMKTDAEWAKLLTPAQFMVCRHKATEPAFSGKYFDSHAAGTYQCVCCGAPLFSSKAKFDSGTGWPSFWQPVDRRRIDSALDYKMIEPRMEVMCNDCGSHLGHVFNDGPPPTGLRFCINSASLKFVRDPSAAGKSKTKAKGRTAKAKAKPESDEKTNSDEKEKAGPGAAPSSNAKAQ